jgi:uncharacterized membrane protein
MIRNAAGYRSPWKVLEPHPQWGWRVYPMRWLLGGGWSVWHLPVNSTLYGAVFFIVFSCWMHVGDAASGSSAALAASLTGLTLLLAPGLTAGLTDGMGRSQRAAASIEEDPRPSALIGLGAFLVMILSISLNGAAICVALFYRSGPRSLEALLADLLSWHGSPLLLMLLGLTLLAGMALQLTLLVPTYLLRTSERDLFRAIRSSMEIAILNWRPLGLWAMTCQALLALAGLLLPEALIIVVPLITCGSWWACRETATGTPGWQAHSP